MGKMASGTIYYRNLHVVERAVFIPNYSSRTYTTLTQ